MSPLGSDEPILHPEVGALLNVAVRAIMRHQGGEAIEVDEDDKPGLLRLARVGPRLVIVERFGDYGKSQPHGYAMFRIAEQGDGAFKIDPANLLFRLQEAHFATPPDWHLQLVASPVEWFDEVMRAIHVALEPFAPRPPHIEMRQ